MKQLLKLRNIPLALFILLELIIYILLIFCDTAIPSRPLSFSAIVLAFLFSLWQLKDHDHLLVAIALFFTLLADTYLVLLDSSKTIAMLAFNVVQIVYAYRIIKYFKIKYPWQIHLILRLVIICLGEVMALIVLKGTFDIVIFLTMMYFANLFLNMLFSIVHFKENWRFAIGLLLFVLCDICVGLGELDSYLTITSNNVIYLIVNSPLDFVWLFYLPSQVFLSTSHFPKTNPLVI